jgi:hypothetical protein
MQTFQQENCPHAARCMYSLIVVIAPSGSRSTLTFCAKSDKLKSRRSMEDYTVSDIAAQLGASKSASTLLVLFIPSHNRYDHPIDQVFWVGEALIVLGECFGGATAFPQGRGVWRDDAQGGKLLLDEPVVIQCYTSESALEEQAEPLRHFLLRMGSEARQGAVGLVIDRAYLEIRFPLEPEDAVTDNGEERGQVS